MLDSTRSLTPTQTRRAYRFGIINGVLFSIGVAFVDPLTVLPALVSRLTESEVVIGSISTIGMSGWFLPQLFAANYLQAKPHKRPLYMFAAALRTTGLLVAIPVLYFLAPARPAAALIGFFVAYSCYSLAGGLSGPAFLDIVAKTIPGRKLGAFFGHRQFWGCLGAIGSGALVRAVLASDAFAFSTDYALLFGSALLVFVPGWILFSLIHEPPGKVPDQPKPLVPFLRSAPATVRRHSEFRLLLVSRLLTGAAGIALPFYIIYAQRVLGVPESMVGTYISVQMTGSVVLVPLWAYLNDRRGPRQLLLAVVALYCAASAIALIASLFPSAVTLGRLALMAVFFPLAAIGHGSFTGYTNYLLAIAPEEERTLYIGIQNTLFAVTSFLPLLGGLIVSMTSFSVLFAVAAAFSAAGMVATVRLPKGIVYDS